MAFQKPTPKWFLIIYSIMISFLAFYSIVLLANNKLGSITFNTYTIFFTLFSILMAGFFLGKKYELRSWAAPLAYLVLGFVFVSIINTFSLYLNYNNIYFLNFIKTIFFLFFVLLVDTLYLHPHVKHIPGMAKLAEEAVVEVEHEVEKEVEKVEEKVLGKPAPAAVKKKPRKKASK